MPQTIIGTLRNELLRAARRAQPTVNQDFKVRQPCFSFSRSFSVRYSLRQPLPRASRASATHPKYRPFHALAAGGGLLAVLFSFAQPVSRHDIEIPVKDPRSSGESTSGSVDDEYPRFRLLEIKEHGPKSAHPWIIYQDKVYDITQWVPAHPGGEVILRAAGGSVEPYWDIFSIHKTPYVREILEQYVVGKVHPDDLEDGRPRMDRIEDPFVADPKRDERLQKLTSKPCNAETAGENLASDFLTPNEVFYVRNHMWVPVIDSAAGDAHGITVELPDGDVRVYTVGELKTNFKQHTVTAVMQCSGNRRKNMTDYAHKTNGLQWGVGAISCAKWEGVRLRDVLADAGLAVNDPPVDAQHVQFSALEAYGASIPIHAALDPRGDVLLAFKMNDMPLPPDHGFPVRVVVPGTVAARCVKWVNKIVVSDEESSTSWQRKDYKCFGPNEVKDLDWDKYKSIQEMPVTSAITRARVKPLVAGVPTIAVSAHDTASHRPDDFVELEGYAYSGGGREVQRVDVSLDGGKTWGQATFLDDSSQEAGSKKWCWKRWTYHGALPDMQDPHEKTATFIVKATDEAYNTQPQCYKSIYNLRGNLATAWHRIEVDIGNGRKEDNNLLHRSS